MVKKIAITGGIGSGKSMVCKIIQAMGYEVFNADAIAKKIINNNQNVRASIKSYFGDNSYTESGMLNSSYISSIVFNDSQKLQCLNQIVHPEVRKMFIDFAKKSTKTIFYEAAILFESKGESDFDAVILVKAPVDLRIKRIIKRDGLEEKEILKRIHSQWDDKKKETLTPYCIVNDEVSPLLFQIEEILSQLSIC